MTLTPEQDAFLRAGRWALVSTTRPSGAPQVSMVAYEWNGTDVVVSTRRTSVKWTNLRRNPRIAITVTDDQRCLTVYGRADCIETGPERDALTRRLQASLLPAHVALLQQDVDRGLDTAGRVVIRLVPERAVGRI